MNIVSLSEDEQGWQNEQAEEMNGGCEQTTSPPIDSVLTPIQLLLSHTALSQYEHTLVQQSVSQCMFVRAKC